MVTNAGSPAGTGFRERNARRFEVDMTEESLKETIRRELPGWLREDPDLRAYVLELTRGEYAGRADTEDRFYAILAELRRDREEQARKWEQQDRKWEQQDRKWEQQDRKWEEHQAELRRDREEQARKWDEHQAQITKLYEQADRDREEQERRWEQQDHKWEEHQAELRRDREEQARKWDEQNRKWEENQGELRRLHEEIMAQAQKHDRSIGALGARWGTQSEKAFRDALASILEKNFRVQVVNVTDFDDTGEVFGHPEQVELDVIITDGQLLVCELKSSIDKAGMYSFERKARFYEKRHQRQANRLIVISPMIDARARKVADRLGIETFGDSLEVEAL
jgi:hypothetical protein